MIYLSDRYDETKFCNYIVCIVYMYLIEAFIMKCVIKFNEKRKKNHFCTHSYMYIYFFLSEN